ncbi:uncharacterized protein TNIN_145241, partial [Trichonephila inaurata madagascariensis]
ANHASRFGSVLLSTGLLSVWSGRRDNPRLCHPRFVGIDGVSRTNGAREPSEARLEEILQSGKEYLPRAMHMTDENSVRWQMMYNHVKSGFPHHHGNCSQNVK